MLQRGIELLHLDALQGRGLGAVVRGFGIVGGPSCFHPASHFHKALAAVSWYCLPQISGGTGSCHVVLVRPDQLIPSTPS